MRSLFSTFLLLLAAAAAPQLRAESAAWSNLELGLANDAATAFAAESDPTPAARLGEALALLHAQPRTAAGVADAIARLEALANDPTAPATDDTRIVAAYQLARARHYHPFTPDRAAAIAAYRALLADHATHPVAAQAAPRLALLLLADPALAANDSSAWLARVAELEALLPRLTEPAARRDLLLVLAEATLRRHRDHARALAYYEIALAEGAITKPSRRGDTLLIAAECARALGRHARAAELYDAFLKNSPRDMRFAEATRRRAALQP